MDTPIVNPVWEALTGRQKHLNTGGEIVKFFNPEVCPFVAMENWDTTNLTSLEAMLPAGRSFSVMIAKTVDIPSCFEIVFSCMLYQMICRKPVKPSKDLSEIRLLSYQHVPEMLALTTLTKPGPFFQNTIGMGDYYGIVLNGQLAAMAGERLKPEGFSEVSAICNHPEHLGRGYASLLTAHVTRKIQEEGAIPFLHVKQDNDRAIQVYQRIGFDVAANVHFAVFKRKG